MVKHAGPTTFHGGADRVGIASAGPTLDAVMDHAAVDRWGIPESR